MSSSDTWLAPPGPRAQPGDGGGGSSSYTRFIPREELDGQARIAAWAPRVFRADAPRTASADFRSLTVAEGDIPNHRRISPQLPQAQDFSALPLPLTRPGDQPGAAAAADDGPAAGHPDPAHPGLAGDHSPRDAQTAWREAVRLELQEELLAEWQDAAEAELQAQTQEARQTGYQDGYRDGLAALDSFKQSYAQQVTGQVAQLLHSLDSGFESLEQQMADGLARIATELARQVVRCELAQRPELVARVAQEAVGSLLHSARQVTVAVHPDDHALVAQGCADLLQARGAHLLARPDIERGGCQVDSDIGSIDARIATRWAQALQTVGQPLPWALPPQAAEAAVTGTATAIDTASTPATSP